jgi:nitrite reductase/ring-hydroxylating ferredoxin subunit
MNTASAILLRRASCVVVRPLSVAIPSIRSFSASPHIMSEEYKLKAVSSLSLQPGDMREVEVEGVEDAKVLLLNAAGTVQAVGPKCTHYGAPLAKGVLSKNGRLTCPWHGGELRLCTSAFVTTR